MAGERIKGKCKYCGKEYAKGYMMRHLRSCKERKARLEAETGQAKCRYFQLVIYGKYDNNYWLIIEMRDDTTLSDLDCFLRDIWLECCGHLSAFRINGISYEADPDVDYYWDEPPRSMDCPLKEVLKEGMRIDYEYDFGSSTDLVIQVSGFRDGVKTEENLTILSRNNAQEWICDHCHTNKATNICDPFLWGDERLFCDECMEEQGCDLNVMLPICNSPRMGVCGYCGSEIYPDQFLPDQVTGK